MSTLPVTSVKLAFECRCPCGHTEYIEYETIGFLCEQCLRSCKVDWSRFTAAELVMMQERLMRSADQLARFIELKNHSRVFFNERLRA